MDMAGSVIRIHSVSALCHCFHLCCCVLEWLLGQDEGREGAVLSSLSAECTQAHGDGTPVGIPCLSVR